MLLFMFGSFEGYECQYQSQAEGILVVRATHIQMLDGVNE